VDTCERYYASMTSTRLGADRDARAREPGNSGVQRLLNVAEGTGS
jgi:hypothetical protein